jgi:hypothetical protein
MLQEILEAANSIMDLTEHIADAVVDTPKETRTANRSSSVEELKARLQKKYADSEIVQKSKTKQGNILERANRNVQLYEADQTLMELEQEHNHTETTSKMNCSSVYQRPATRGHPYHPEDNVSLLGSTEDLIVMGFDGNLQYERDFVAEGERFLVKISLM